MLNKKLKRELWEKNKKESNKENKEKQENRDITSINKKIQQIQETNFNQMKNKKTSEQEIGKNIVKPLQIITNRDIKVNKKRTVKKMCHINTQNTL